MTTTQTITQTAGLVGNLASDPELNFSAKGTAYLKARLSVKPYVPGATEQPEPVYYSVVCFGSLAENAATSLRKGSRVCAVGKLEHEPWTGRDGVERVTQKLIADGIGPDLRFAGTTSTRPKATPVDASTSLAQPTPTLDGLLGPAPSHDYQDEPF